MTPPVLAAIAWDDVVDRAAQGIGITTVVQPIVDVARGVVAGYEALTRVDTPGVTTEELLDVARARGVGAAVEAVMLERALALRPDVPPNCFLSTNVDPAVLSSPAIRRVLDAHDDLGGVVLELTEHTAVGTDAHLGDRLAACRAAGAMIAIDDAGAGYAGLQSILTVRPEFLKVDRIIVDGLHHDEAKRVTIAMLGELAARLDAWLLVEGVEHAADAAAVVELGVPLVQGWYFGHPAPPWPTPSADVLAPLRWRATLRAQGQGTIAPLVAWAPTVVRGDWEGARQHLAVAVSERPFVVMVDSGRPIGVLDPSATLIGEARSPLVIGADTTLAEVSRCVLTRPAQARFDPVVVCSPAGVYLGVVTVERLLDRLAAHHHPEPSDDSRT